MAYTQFLFCLSNHSHDMILQLMGGLGPAGAERGAVLITTDNSL